MVSLTPRMPAIAAVALPRCGPATIASIFSGPMPVKVRMPAQPSDREDEPLASVAGMAAQAGRPVKIAGVAPPHSARPAASLQTIARSEEHTSELQSLMRISYAVFCLKKKKQTHTQT